ncbi:hypothetical protein ACXYTP_12155 [Tsukamurella ocularis]|uniref:hypothetical protein n=1 Tax=Tsukamurella ocularis TaxID=1970234 RepID=UPI0039EF5531
MRTLRNTLAVGAAVAALVVPTAVAQADPGAPSTSVDQLLLADGEFPAGYEVMPLSVAERLEMIAPLNQFAKNLKVTPAECAPKITPALQQKAGDLPMVSAFSDRTTTGLVEVISPRAVGTNADMLNACSDVTVELEPNEQVPAEAHITIKVTRASVPGVPAGAMVIATQGSGTVTVRGKDGKPGKERKVVVNQVEGVSQVRGLTVVVTASGSQGGRLDRAAFAQTLTRAVDKVRAAK